MSTTTESMHESTNGKTWTHRKGGAERDEEHTLRTRVCILEAALACIAREAEVALGRPDIAFLTMCRVSAVARQAGAQDSSARAYPTARCR